MNFRKPELGINILDSVNTPSYHALDEAGFQDFCRVIFPLSSNLKQERIAMLAGYFDESGMDGRSPFFSISGYVSTVEKWSEFSRKWKQASDKANIPDFHMTDFVARRRSPYTDLTDSQHAALLQRLSTIINQHTEFCFRVGFLESDYEELGGGNEVVRNAWQLLTMMVIMKIAVWAVYNGHGGNIPLTFDSGARYSGDFFAAYNGLVKTSPALKRDMHIGSFILADDSEVLPLKAADMVAWETSRYQNGLLTGRGEKIRPNLVKLLKKPHFDEFPDREKLQRCMTVPTWQQISGEE